jgi:hypothetical protein
MTVYITDLTDEGLRAYKLKMLQDELNATIEKVIDAGVCPLCGGALTKEKNKFLKIFHYSYSLICPIHGIVKKYHKQGTMC